MRKLASIRKISDIQPIKDADAIEVATVDGWKVVVKKGEYSVGELAVYVEIDSWVPHKLAPFLSKGQEPREYNGVKGERLRTVKLRGQVSQGLLLPLTELVEGGDRYGYAGSIEIDNKEYSLLQDLSGQEPSVEDGTMIVIREGSDVTDWLRIQKWEAPISPQLAGQVRGQFPTHLIPKTDQERIQNCFEEINSRKTATYEVTLKLDGTSCTIFRHEEELRVCSRNLELKINDENQNNTLVATALKLSDRIPGGFALQGELMGPGIQSNREGFTTHRFFVFDIFDINTQKYLEPLERREFCLMTGLEHIPYLGVDWSAPKSVEEGLEIAEGLSINHKIREGLVWKCNEDPIFSFKTISNKFLLKGGN